MIATSPEKFLEARKAAKLNVKQAARAAKLNYKTIEALEGHGENPTPERPRLETLFVLAGAYGCTPRDFARDPAEWDTLLQTIGLMAIPSPTTAATQAAI